LRLRVYTPAATDAHELPALIYFHGGGFVFGGLDTHDGICRRITHESGCRLIAVDYRLAPEHPFPAAVEDGLAATRWIANHARDLGIATGRLAIGGDSAGANLAAVVCQQAGHAAQPRLALQVLLCPVLDMDIDTPSRLAFARGHFLDRTTMEWSLRHVCPAGTDLADPRISPLRSAELAGLPPAHIHTAEFDPLRDEGEAYADRLARAGVKVRYRCHDGMIHHFYGLGGVIPYARVAMTEIGAAIGHALA
jgi:acetyl esterase/lipase